MSQTISISDQITPYHQKSSDNKRMSFCELQLSTEEAHFKKRYFQAFAEWNPYEGKGGPHLSTHRTTRQNRALARV